MTSPGGAILLISDIHAHYHVVDAQIAHAQEKLDRPVDQVLILGDFGLFGSNLHDYFRRGRRDFLRPVAFIEGNHEDFRNFDSLVDQYKDVATYLPRSSVQHFNSRSWLCIGGARYMDSWSTPPGCEIREQDITACLTHAPGSIDFVISHDCPTGVGVTNGDGLQHLGPPGVEGLARVADHLQPRLWFFGHHHRWHDNEVGPTRFVGLPQSWQGYVLLDGAGELQRVEHEVGLPKRPGWLRWIGLK